MALEEKAKVTITLDNEQAMKQLKDLQKQVQDSEDKTKKNQEQQEKSKQEQNKVEEDNKRKAEKLKFRLQIPNLEDIPYIGAGVKFAELGAPVSKAFIQSILPEGIIQDAVKETVGKTVDKLSDSVSDIQSRLNSIQPAINDFNDILRSQLLLGRPPSAEGSFTLLKNLYDINTVQDRTARQIKKVVFEQGAGTIAEGFQHLLKRSTNQ